MTLQRISIILTLTLGALLTLGYWWELVRPVSLVDAPSDRLSCVSYAPFHKPGQRPLDKEHPVGIAQITADLGELAKRFDCVRTYTVAENMREVPRIASQLGIKVLMGIWIGRNAEVNEQEIATGIDMARQYRDAIRGVIVGNEVLLRKEQTPAAMRAYLQRIGAALPGVQVSYADAWEYWLRYRDELLPNVGFATVHILPYWEDDPISVNAAVAHVVATYRHVRSELGGRDVLIGETGWPSYGRTRQEAVASAINQAGFIREFAARADEEHIPYNVIEAFDQPWKRNSEGAVGGYWGLYAADGAAKFPFRGPVAEAAAWKPCLGLTIAGFWGGLCWLAWRRRVLNAPRVLLALAIGIVAGGSWLLYWRDVLLTSRGWLEWAIADVYALLLIVAAFLLAPPLMDWCATGRAALGWNSVARLLARDGRDWRQPANVLGALRFVLLFSMALVCLVLVFDLRARDFPVALFVVPAGGLALLAWIKPDPAAGLEESVLAGWIGLAGPIALVSEHLVFVQDQPWRWADGLNLQAGAWCALCLAIAWAVLAPVLAELQTQQRQNA